MNVFLLLGYALPIGLIVLALWLIVKKRWPLKVLGIIIILVVALMVLLGNQGGGMVKDLL